MQCEVKRELQWNYIKHYLMNLSGSNDTIAFIVLSLSFQHNVNGKWYC